MTNPSVFPRGFLLARICSALNTISVAIQKRDTQRVSLFCILCKPYLPLYVFIVRSAPTLTNDKIASPKSFKRSGISLFSSSEKSPRT